MGFQPFPERRTAIFITHATHFGYYGFGEAFLVFLHKQKTDFRQKAAVEALAGTFPQEQRTNLAYTGVVVTKRQNFHRVVDIQLA